MKARTKLLVGVLLLAAVASIAVITTQAADSYREVHQVAANEAFVGDVVSVKGRVRNESIHVAGPLVTFALADNSGLAEHAAATLPVEYAKTLPDNFGPKNVVVTGRLAQRDGGLVLLAESIQVGCSSKY